MKIAAVGLLCFAAGCGATWAYCTSCTVKHVLRVTMRQHRGTP